MLRVEVSMSISEWSSSQAKRRLLSKALILDRGGVTVGQE